MKAFQQNLFFESSLLLCASDLSSGLSFSDRLVPAPAAALLARMAFVEVMIFHHSSRSLSLHLHDIFALRILILGYRFVYFCCCLQTLLGLLRAHLDSAFAFHRLQCSQSPVPTTRPMAVTTLLPRRRPTAPLLIRSLLLLLRFPLPLPTFNRPFLLTQLLRRLLPLRSLPSNRCPLLNFRRRRLPPNLSTSTCRHVRPSPALSMVGHDCSVWAEGRVPKVLPNSLPRARLSLLAS